MESDSAQYTNPKHFNAYTGAGTPPREKGHKVAHAKTGSGNPHNPGHPHAHHPADPDDTAVAIGNARLLQLTQKLSQYTRGSDRRQVLRSLTDPQLLPRIHTLKSVWVEDIAAAEREAAGERAVLNGVKFLQVKRGGGAAGGASPNDDTPVDSYFLQTLREICGHMCDMDGVDADPMALYGGLLLRLARSVSERDALEVVTRWACGKGELVVLPLKRRHHHRPGAKGDAAPAGLRPTAPLDVELYVEAGSVHAKVTVSHELGIYRRADLESHGLTRELSAWSALVLANQKERLRSPTTGQKLGRLQYEALGAAKFPANLRPWIFVDGDVVERINFGTGSSVRMLHVSLPKDKNSGYVKKW